MPLVNQNQMLRCLQIGMTSTFALTIWLYLITFIFYMCHWKWMKEMMKTHSKKTAIKSIKISFHNHTWVIVETKKITLKINWKTNRNWNWINGKWMNCVYNGLSSNGKGLKFVDIIACKWLLIPLKHIEIRSGI